MTPAHRLAGIAIAALGAWGEYRFVTEVLQGGVYGLKLIMAAPFVAAAGVLAALHPPGTGPFPQGRLLYVLGFAGTAANIALYFWRR